jgi:hypothetical protein
MTAQFGGEDQGPGGGYRKGYTRVCKTYRLTAAGRAIAEPIRKQVEARADELGIDWLDASDPVFVNDESPIFIASSFNILP